MHKPVYHRFAAGPVVLFDKLGAYRPKNMKNHVDFVQYFDSNNLDPKEADPEKWKATADDLEYKWEQKLAADAAASVNGPVVATTEK
jgi:hypothetical protein